MAMTKVMLYGHLRKEFGKQFEFDINTPAEAVRALKANCRGFYSALLKHKPGYHVFVGTETISTDKFDHPVREVIRIVPVVAGAGKLNPLLLIVAAVAIIASAGALATLAGSAFTLSAGTVASLTGTLGQIGASLAIMGVSALFASAPRKEDDAKPSYIFSGAENTAAQGGCVPVGYGRMKVGSVTLSAGLYVGQNAPIVSEVPTAPITGPVIEGPIYPDLSGQP
jgi:predicted phage tail protein